MVRITFPHLAFFRSVLQHISLRDATDRYLVPGLDLRVADRELGRIRQTLRYAALRHGRPQDAALFLRNAEVLKASLPQREIETVTLEAFQREVDPTGSFYREAELIALYQARYGKSRAGPGPKARLIARQLAALERIAPLVAAEPTVDDKVDAWFSPWVSRYLADASIKTLDQLVSRINLAGHRWWRQVPGIGAEIGAEITRWVHANRAALGRELLPFALVPFGSFPGREYLKQLPKVPAIVPLERLRVPEGLSGEFGVNRAPQAGNKLSAQNDLTAIHAWLSLRREDSHTYRAYRREAERFLLWCIFDRKKALSSILTEDCIAYRDFLIDPQPSMLWCGRERVPRFSDAWRPFRGPLSANSQKTAQIIVATLFEWLSMNRYLDFNPWRSVPHLTKRVTRLDTSRSFTEAQWAELGMALRELPENAAGQRLGFMLIFTYSPGLRLSELAKAKLGDFFCSNLARDLREAWDLKVTGKGEVMREIPLPPKLMELVEVYLTGRGLSHDPRDSPPDTPLLGRLTGDAGTALTSSAIYKTLKFFFTRVADDVESRNAAMAKRIAKASTHWLRHTFATHAVAKEVPVEVLQQVLGHASLTTTTVYITTEKAVRHRQMGKFFAGR